MKLTKKFLSLVLVLCLFSSIILTANALDGSVNIEDDGGTVSPLWNKDTHLSIIDRAYSACDITIPDTYITLMNRISIRCDEYWQSHMAFHGRGNYLATQKFLWKYCRLIVKYDPSKHGTMLEYAESVANTVDNIMPDDVSVVNAPTRGPADNEQEIYEDMVDILPTIMNNYYSVPDPNPAGQTIQRRCKYVVMGILAHFYGDLTAHRTLVPTSAIPSDPNNFDSTVQFDLTDFDQPYRGYLISDVNEQKTCFREIPYYKTSGNVDKRKALNKAYTDNEEFFPRRVGLAVHYLKRFFNKLSNGYSEAVIYHKGIYTEFNIEAYDDYYDNIE